MHFNRGIVATLLSCLAMLQTGSVLYAQQQPRKIAFIVGVSEYQKDGLNNLKYADKDANDLAEELSKHGFDVSKLIGSHARHKTVREKLGEFIELTGELGKKDVVLVSFSGHGVQKSVSIEGRKTESPFFCVYDTLVTNPETMISLNYVLEQLKQKSGCSSNLLIVDACRNNPDKGARTLDGSTVKELPTKISMLFSSLPGQRSFESEKVEQGVFTHVLLQGLRGEAKDRNGNVDWLNLATYAMTEVPLQASSLLDSTDIEQRPNFVGNLLRSPVIVDAPPKLTFTKPVSNKIGMQFRRVPKGKFKMGSPVAEQSRDDDEFLHDVEIKSDFYFGVHEVTKAQWSKVMGYQPWSGNSEHNASDASPANYINHREAYAFCLKLSISEGRLYRLPTEAEWEYACRGGTSSMFSFGNDPRELLDYSWSPATSFGHEHDVGKLKPNPLGLYDLHGNVWEWCSEKYEKDYHKSKPNQIKYDATLQLDDTLGVMKGGCFM